MSYVYLLDGVDRGAPVNDKDLLTTIKRGANLDGFLVTQDADLVWQGDAYTYLYNKFNSDNYCSEVEVDIIDECENGQVFDIYTGIIKMSTLKFEEQTCTARGKVMDNSFYSYINNNKSYGVSPTQNGTKNGVEISPPDIWEIRVFDPSTGVYDLTTRKAYRVYDLLEHAITVITDGRVGFVSDFLWNQSEELFLTTGNALSVSGNAAIFTYSFDKLYSELNKIFNLSFFIETDLYQLPTLRIEPKGYFYSNSTGVTFSDIKELTVSVDETKLYGTVLLGSTILSDNQGVFLFNENQPFYGFKQEKFYPLGQCNLDTELNLINDYVISSLVIEDCIIGLSSNYYDELFFVSCENLDVVNLTADAIGYQLGGVAPPYIYNLNLNNYNKAQRHFEFLQGNLLNSFNVSSNNFHAEHNAITQYYVNFIVPQTGTQIPFLGVQPNGNYAFQLTVNPFSFPDESSPGNYDLGGNYDNTTFEYTVPADGRYTFVSKIFFDAVTVPHVVYPNSVVYVNIQRYDSGMVFIEDNPVSNPIPTITGVFLAEGSAAFDCVAGDIIICGITIYMETNAFPVNTTQFAIKATAQSYFESTADNVIVGASAINYKVIKFEFQLPVSQDDFRALLADPTGVQTFTKWSDTLEEFNIRRAWLDEFRYNNWTGLANIKLVANNAINEE